jgi:hypothetical protein
MTSSIPSHAEEMTHRLSVEIFGEDMSRSNPPNSYYQQNSNPPHPYYQQILSQQYNHHNRMLILITTRKSLPLVPDKIRPHFRKVLINIRQVPNIIPIQQLVVDFYRYIQ